MSQAQLAADTIHPELARELPADPHARAETRAKAAHNVAAFVQSSALNALDALLDGNDPAAARLAADRSIGHARLLDAEVGRFRALADQAT